MAFRLNYWHLIGLELGRCEKPAVVEVTAVTVSAVRTYYLAELQPSQGVFSNGVVHVLWTGPQAIRGSTVGYYME